MRSGCLEELLHFVDLELVSGSWEALKGKLDQRLAISPCSQQGLE